MGFLDNNNDAGSSGSTDKLDLVEYESNLIKKFNDTGILNTKYMAEEFGITFSRKLLVKLDYLFRSSYMSV